MAMSANVKAGGTWRKATKLYVKSGGSWRTIKAAWVKSGGSWRQFFSGGAVLVSSVNCDVYAQTDQPNPATASAGISFVNDGSMNYSTSTIDPGTSIVSTGFTTNPGADDCSGISMRVTATSGSFTSGTTGTWLNMATSRTYTKTSRSGSVSFTVEFSYDAGATTAFSSNGSLNCTNI